MIFKTIDLLDEPSPFQNESAYEQKQHNWSALRNYMLYLNNYMQSGFADYDTRFNAQINKTEQPSEIVDARIDAVGKQYPTLKARLDTEQEASVQVANTGNTSTMPAVVKVVGLTTSSAPFKYVPIGTNQISFGLPDCGYAEIPVANLSTSNA